MTTAERTMCMYQALPKAEQLSVQRYIAQLFASHKRTSKHILRPITEDEFIAKIDHSRELAKEGKVYTWSNVERKMAKKYGF